MQNVNHANLPNGPGNAAGPSTKGSEPGNGGSSERVNNPNLPNGPSSHPGSLPMGKGNIPPAETPGTSSMPGKPSKIDCPKLP